MSWQKASEYNWRALVEADIGRWKRVIGHALCSQTDKRQATEVALAVDVLNRMLALDARATSASYETMRTRDHCVHRLIHATRSHRCPAALQVTPTRGCGHCPYPSVAA